MIDIDSWIKEYQDKINNYFGNRVKFIGLQGSYARGEATTSSDIDVVLIMDKVDINDLSDYKKIVDKMPYRELLCGFVSGVNELSNWSKSDLFQFYFDTIATQGNLDTIIPHITHDDARQAALNGACNIYHACSHNYLHNQEVDMLKSLYKSAFFVLQAYYYYKNDKYIRSKREFREYISEDDEYLLEAIINTSKINHRTFEEYSQILLNCSSRLIGQLVDNDIHG